jgi:hypothetical protein
MWMNVDLDVNEQDSVVTSQEDLYLYLITSWENFKLEILKLKYNNISELK